MDGVIYYPYIRVPKSAWFSRAALYWDSVATIVPDRWIQDPNQLGPYTLDLVQRGIVTQLFPSYTNLQSLGGLFKDYVGTLESKELDRRRRNFRAGKTDVINQDKITEDAFYNLDSLMLAGGTEGSYNVEQRTAADYMAALALALSVPGHAKQIATSEGINSEADRIRWVPVTDQAHSLLPLLAGTVEASNSALRERAEGQSMVGLVQMMVLERLFPAPLAPVPPSELEKFRHRHAGLLPEFRREVEARVDVIFNLRTDWEQRRALDRIESEFQDAIRQVEAYMSESRFGRLVRSRWWALLGLIPGLDRLAGGATVVANIADPAPAQVRSPFAYAAFASAKLSPRRSSLRMVGTGPNSLMNVAFYG